MNWFLIYSITLLLLVFISCNTDSSEPDSDKDFKSVVTNTDNFLFVGIKGETPSLFMYDLNRNKHKQFWYKPREIVIDLSISPNYLKAFFITALSIEEGGILPLIRKIKLYLVDLKTMEVTLIKTFGNAGQIITSWEDENNFKIILNTIDIIIATEINQTTQLFNSFGKLLIDESKTFDLLKDGYPQLPKTKKNFESPSKRYSLQVSEDERAWYINDRATKQQDTISSYPLWVNQFAWSYDDNFIAANFNVRDIQNQHRTNQNTDTTLIVIYSLINKKKQREWKGAGLKNYLMLNNFLIFDDGLGEESEIIIYNFVDDKVISNIRLNGGCGLKNIPGILTYDVVD